MYTAVTDVGESLVDTRKILNQCGKHLQNYDHMSNLYVNDIDWKTAFLVRAGTDVGFSLILVLVSKGTWRYIRFFTPHTSRSSHMSGSHNSG